MAGIIGLITAAFFPTGSYASISENFESAEVGTPPAGWTFMENWGDSGTIKVHDSVGNNSSKSVRIVGKPSWAQGIYLPGSVIASDVQIAFDVYVESGGVPEYPSAYFIYNGVTLDLRPDGDTFVIMVDHSTVNQIGPFEAATWHRVNMSLDRADGTISLTIDQYELKNIAVTLDESGGWGSDISLYGDNNGNVASYFDNVSLDVITSGEKLEIIEANAKWEDNHDPMNAIDLDISVGYHSAGTHSFDRDPDMWWEADLGSVQPVSRISVFWQAVISWKEIEIRGSQDGITYSNLIGRTRVNTDGSWTNFDIAGDYRFLRLFYVGSGAGGEGLDLMEFEVYAVRDLDNGLVAYYPFNGNARDESGNGNHGIEYGGITYLGGKSVSFDGVDDYIEIQTHSALRPAYYSVSFWLNTNQYEDSSVFSSNYHHSSVDANGYSVFVKQSEGGGIIANNFTRSTGNFGVESETRVNDGQWHHVVVTWDGVYSNVYIDGEIDASLDVRTTHYSSGPIRWTEPYRNLFMGTFKSHDYFGGTSTIRNYQGYLDNLRLYDRVLSESEIQGLYTEGSSESHTLIISVSPSSGGTISRSPDKSEYENNETVTLTATPAECHDFTGWSGDCSGTSPACTLTMDADKSVTANFAPKRYTLSITADNGTVSRDPHSLSYNCESHVSLTAVPDSGYAFDHWTGDVTGNQPEITLTMEDEMAVTAVFVAKNEPQISFRPNFLEIYEDTEDRSQAFYAQNVASAEIMDEKGKGLVIPHTVVKHWRNRKPRFSYHRQDLAKSEDWSGNDSPVKNQRGCGSCWAFAAAALTENLGNRDDLSEQVLVSCVSKSNGCGSGWYGYALEYIQNNGLPPEDCHPYIAENGNCENQCASPSSVVKVDTHDTYGQWGVPDEETVSNLKYLLQTGPVLVSMLVPDDGTFSAYKSGIYDYEGNAIPENRGHAVLVVGYNDDGQYFRAKNSWGPGWGEDGYFRIAYDDITDDVQFGGYACTASGAHTAEEGDVDKLTFVIENSGTGDLNVSISADKSWLAYAPQNISSISPGEKKEVAVSVSDWSEVPEPEDTATISIGSNDPDNPLLTVSVRAVPKSETGAFGIISGQVVTHVAGHPVNVAGATVTVQGRSAVSDAVGQYTLVNVPTGRHDIRFESEYLGSVTTKVTVTQGQISVMPPISLSCATQTIVNMQDIDGDTRVGLAEAIRALQIVAGIITD